MTFEQIITDLKNKIYHPVYFLQGEEPYYIDLISGFIEDNVLSDAEKEFNQTIVYGRDADPSAIIDLARRYPMMSNYQVVVVREAQDLEEIEKLQYYMENPVKSTLLVLAYKYKKLDKRKTFAKSIEKNGILFESNRIYDNQVAPWIQQHLTEKGYSISPKACQLLSEYLGTDLGKIQNELEKLTLNISPGTKVTEEIIEKNIGISKDYNIFELQQALGTRNTIKANRIVRYFAANPKQNPAVVVLTILFTFFFKVMIYHQMEDKSRNAAASVLSINPFFVKDFSDAANNYTQRDLRRVIRILREYDLKVKGVNNASSTEGELLREMVYRILH